jgi:hypothetical protein
MRPKTRAKTKARAKPKAAAEHSKRLDAGQVAELIQALAAAATALVAVAAIFSKTKR